MRLVMLLLSACLGMALIALWPTIPALANTIAWPLCLLLLALALVLVRRVQAAVSGTQQYRRVALLLLSVMLAGHCWAMDWAANVLSQRLPASWVRQDLWVRGQITSLVEPSLQGQRFTLRVDSVCLRLLPEHCEWQSARMSGARLALRDYSALTLLPGEHWRLRVRLRPVHGQANPGGYDLELQRFAQGITTQGYVRETAFNTRTDRETALSANITAEILQGRQRIADRLGQSPQLHHSGILTALIIGATQGMDDATWDLLALTGTTHLLVVSGLHVGLIAAISYALCRLLLRYLPWCFPGLMTQLFHWQPAQRFAAVAAMLSATVYSMLAGFSLPTQRALIMTAVLLLGRSGRYRLRSSQSLMLAATLVLMLNPLAIWQAGFWMSFVAVAALLLAMTGYWRRRPALAHGWLAHFSWSVIRPQLVVTIALLVPLMAGPGSFSLISPLSNIVAIPLMGLLIVPAALGGALLESVFFNEGAVNWLWQLADTGITALLQWLQWMASLVVQLQRGLNELPANWQAGSSPGWLAWMLAAIASFLLLLPRGMLPRLPAMLLFLPLVWPAKNASSLGPNELLVTVIDVGQGLSVLLQTTHRNVLYDTGPPRGEGAQAARGILPVLQKLGVERLDVMIISHWHDDHAGALTGLLAQMPIATVFHGGEAAQLPESISTDASWQPCRQGQYWREDGVMFHFLHPDSNDPGTVYQPNNTSCVLRVSTGAETLLLAGDIEAAVEQQLVGAMPGLLDADWLLAPHHGSNTSSTQALLSTVDPDCLLISAGAYNRFDHPHPAVVSRAESLDICWLNTAATGALQRLLPASKTSLSPEAKKHTAWQGYRQQNPHFWRAPPYP